MALKVDYVAKEAAMKHAFAFRRVTGSETELDPGGNYHYRVTGEYHLITPLTVSKMQHAVRLNRFDAYMQFARQFRNAHAPADKRENLQLTPRLQQAIFSIPKAVTLE